MASNLDSFPLQNLRIETLSATSYITRLSNQMPARLANIGYLLAGFLYQIKHPFISDCNYGYKMNRTGTQSTAKKYNLNNHTLNISVTIIKPLNNASIIKNNFY